MLQVNRPPFTSASAYRGCQQVRTVRIQHLLLNFRCLCAHNGRVGSRKLLQFKGRNQSQQSEAADRSRNQDKIAGIKVLRYMSFKDINF
jgi:hypothetical protein